MAFTDCLGNCLIVTFFMALVGNIEFVRGKWGYLQGCMFFSGSTNLNAFLFFTGLAVLGDVKSFKQLFNV